jgi:hypothetical protein
MCAAFVIDDYCRTTRVMTGIKFEKVDLADVLNADNDHAPDIMSLDSSSHTNITGMQFLASCLSFE